MAIEFSCAIYVKYLAATDTKGERFRISSARRSKPVTVGYDHSLNYSDQVMLLGVQYALDNDINIPTKWGRDSADIAILL